MLRQSNNIECKRRPASERGAAMVEFVIVLPILIVLIFGIVQASIGYNRLQALHAAAREGARVASVPGSTQGEVNSAVTNALVGVNFDSTPGAPTVSPGGCAGRFGETVTVTVSATYTVNIPLLLSRPVNMQGVGVFRCE